MVRKRQIIAVGIMAAAPAVAAIFRQKFAERHARRRQIERDDVVEEAGLESFPASDPPGWALGSDEHQ